MEENKTNKNDWLFGCGGCLGIIIILGLVLFLFMGCMADMTEEQKKEDSKQEKAEKKKEDEQKEIDETNKRLEEKAKKTEEENKKEEKTEEEKFAEKQIKLENKSSNIEKEIKKLVSKKLQSGDVKNVKLYSDSIGTNLTIEILGSENISNKLTVKAMKYNVLDGLYALKDTDEEFDNISINVKYPLTDSMGKSKNEYVIKSKWNQNIIKDMSSSSKYSMVNDMENLSKSYWEHPALSE